MDATGTMSTQFEPLQANLEIVVEHCPGVNEPGDGQPDLASTPSIHPLHKTKEVSQKRLDRVVSCTFWQQVQCLHSSVNNH